MSRPRWILDLHVDFPGSALVAQQIPNAIVLEEKDIRLGRWPIVSGPVVGYGTMRTMTRLQRAGNIGIAVFDNYPSLRCSSYYRTIYDLLGRMCVFVPFNALPLLPLKKMFGPQVFVRSNTNYKLFPAAVLNADDATDWLATYRHHADELVVVAEYVRFDREYRIFCRNGNMFCGSSYPHEPYSQIPENVRLFAEGAAQRLLPTGINMITIDVGLTDENGTERLRIVEVGGVNSWGIYGSDIDNFIRTMEAEAIDRAIQEN